VNQEVAFDVRRKRASAKVIFVDAEGRVLIIRSTKGEGYWSLPGGVCELNESPLQAAGREVAEEIGLARTPQQLLAANYDNKRDIDSICLLFFGGIVSEAEKTAITLQPEEVDAFEFLPPEEAVAKLIERGPLLQAGLTVLKGGTPVYLENMEAKP
jgi:ADP-ribose pyrophosphatase YjhB (NUDIX family)